MAEATLYAAESPVTITAASAITYGEVRQLPNGDAGVHLQLEGHASGDRAPGERKNQYTVSKTVGVVILQGQEVYWDHSANSATYAPASDRDFFLGSAIADAAASDTSLTVNLNIPTSYKIDINRGTIEDACGAAIVKTAGTPNICKVGQSSRLELSATAEAQKLDILSRFGFSPSSKWIVEGQFTVVDDGDASAIDFNIGVANGTHASDADAITESCFLHLDGNTLDLFAESDDGTTEVNATDTTVNIALGTPVHFVIDGRNLEDIQIYVNGSLVLGSTVFKLNAAAGPLKLLAHLEKTADDTTAEYYVDFLRVRTAQQ